jgi:hypothetical protein
MASAIAAAMGGANPAGAPGVPEATASPMAAAMPPAAGQMSAETAIQTKSDDPRKALERWTEILDRSIERVLERQQRVVLEKAASHKARKSLMSGTLDVESIFAAETWARQMDEDVKPVLSAISKDAAEIKSVGYDHDAANAVVATAMARVRRINSEIEADIVAAIGDALNVSGEDARTSKFKSELVGIYARHLGKQRWRVADEGARAVWE